MPRYRILIRETYVMVHEADTPAEAGEKAMSCMNDHPDHHIYAQEMQFLPIDDEEEEWESVPQSSATH